MQLKRWLAGLVLLVGSVASAQAYVSNTTPNVPYPALTNPTAVTLVTTSGDPLDRGRATVSLGFDFPFYDKTYREAQVNANGLIFFEFGTCTTCDYASNSTLPNTSLPNALIAPFWDDLKGLRSVGAPGVLQTEALSGPNGAGIAIEWNDWNQWSSSSAYQLTFQVRLWANGIIEFYYGTMTGSGAALSASIGIEDPVGNQGVQVCGTACTLNDIVQGQRVVFGPPPPPDLSATSLVIDSVSTNGANLQINTRLGLRNFGQGAASNFSYRLFLSTNTTYEPASDTPLTPAAQGPLNIPALGLLSHTASSTVAKPTSGSYYVIAVVDDTNAVAESNELNNLAAISAPLISGVDLVAENITGPTSSGPGETVINNILFTNRGMDAPGAQVPYKIWVSADATWQATDIEVHSGALTVAGGQTVNENVSYALPTNIPTGAYYFILQLDDGPQGGVIAEVSETNNVKVSSATFTARQSDLEMESVIVLEPAPPYRPADVAFFGENIRLSATVSNLGGATASNFTVAFYLSNNETLNAFNDPFIGEVTNVTVAPGATQTVVFTGPVPSKAVNGSDLPLGDYYFFASAAGPFAEINNTNNFNKSDPFPVRGPAPDLVATSMIGPAQVGTGELMVVTRTLRNIGNRPASAAAYRFYLSANPIITEDDLLLPIQTATGEVTEQMVTLAAGQEDIGTITVRVPAGVPAATYYLGVLIDPPGAGGTGQVLETRENNNGLASQTIQVVPQLLGLHNGLIPDGVVGLPYEYVLSGKGGDDTYTFTLLPGAGTLPEGLELSSSGRISGTPTTAQTVAFSVVIASGGKEAEARVVMRVVPMTASLSITTTLLPPAVRLNSYDYYLAAQGGLGPYRWSVDSGALPSGLTLMESGRLIGTPSGALGEVSNFALRVRDGAGNTEVKPYSLTVVDGSSILIQVGVLPDASIGSEYLVDVLARNANGTPVARPLEWTVVGGGLPLGLGTEQLDDVLLLKGVPREPGQFPVTFQVKDAKGRVDLADFVLVVHPSILRIQGLIPTTVYQGTEVSVQLTAGEGTRWSIFGGLLPDGLTLSEGGLLSGTVSEQAAFGGHNFTILAVGEQGTQAMRGVSMEVARGTDPAKGCGCSGGGGAGLFGFGGLLLGVAAVRRRSRFAR